MSRSDGFRRGTNYNQKLAAASRASIADTLLAAASQHARCARGEHDETVAEQGRVTYLAFGRRVEPGTRYCRYCSTVLGEEAAS